MSTAITGQDFLVYGDQSLWRKPPLRRVIMCPVANGVTVKIEPPTRYLDGETFKGPRAYISACAFAEEIRFHIGYPVVDLVRPRLVVVRSVGNDPS